MRSGALSSPAGYFQPRKRPTAYRSPQRAANLYQNLYHRWLALAGTHQCRFGENPLNPALTSAHESSDQI